MLVSLGILFFKPKKNEMTYVRFEYFFCRFDRSMSNSSNYYAIPSLTNVVVKEKPLITRSSHLKHRRDHETLDVAK